MSLLGTIVNALMELFDETWQAITEKANARRFRKRVEWEMRNAPSQRTAGDEQ
jgi:hypothetical protein